MDLQKLTDILTSTTVQLRNGPEVSSRGFVTEINFMPHQTEVEGLTKVDMDLLTVGVDADKAAARKAELIALLNTYPDPDRLADGPSYIEVGGVIGDQGAAFQLFALGQVLGLWRVITPTSMGVTGDAGRELAGKGFIMITGYRRD